jgi:hypothetical protein
MVALMMNLDVRTSLLAFSLLTVVACDTPEAEFGAGEVEDRCMSCGIKLNTNKIGSHVFSEIDTTGLEHDGVRLNYVEIYRVGKLDKVFVEAGQLMGIKGNQNYDGRSFIGALFYLDVEVATGVWEPAVMRVDAVDDTNLALHGHKYTFSHRYLNGPKEYYPSCDKDEFAVNGAEFDAIVTGDVTIEKYAHINDREHTIMIGCLSGGIGKAGYWGYPKHKVGSNENFTAAIRMVRADYCGNGESFTEPGQKVGITDQWGYSNLPSTPVDLEALWDQDGAACVYLPRLAITYPVAQDVMNTCAAMQARPVVECKWDETLTNSPYSNLLFMSVNP